MNSQFVLEQLSLGKRIDGRDPLQMRYVQCYFGPNNTGAVELSLGETRVFANTSAVITTPNQMRPSEGFLKFHIDLQVLRDGGQMNNPQKLSMEIEKYIEKVIKGSKALDTESLCILSGKNVWAIDVNVILINNDGNLVDAMHLCTLLSLLHFRRPQVSVSTQGVKVEVEKRLVPLSIHHIPLSISYAIFELNDQTIVLQDPNAEEEAIQNGRISFSVNIYNDICHVLKPGGSPIQVQVLQQLTTVTLMKAKPFSEELRTLLKKSEGFPVGQKVQLFNFKLPEVNQIEVEELEQLYNNK